MVEFMTATATSCRAFAYAAPGNTPVTRSLYGQAADTVFAAVLFDNGHVTCRDLAYDLTRWRRSSQRRS